jgi:3-methyladenine DNA glycosylase AlkC
MEPFKNLLNPALVQAASAQFHRAWAGFDRVAFERQALDGLEALELKARAQHIAAALQDTLPSDFSQAAAILEASLAPPRPADAGVADPGIDDTGLRGWIVWPMTEWVARQGLAHPQRALATLHALTQRLTAEWAIRPFIEAHPALTWATLQRWTTDPSEHVRRLVSEGSRPRLPWGQQLKGLIKDPSPTLPLLRALQDDPSAYVRRSVANHLNDIAKDHPGLVVDWVSQHLPGASPERQALLRHACRTLIKQGEPQILRLWGAGAGFEGKLRLRLSPRALVLGESLQLQLDLRSTSDQPQSLLIDYAVHHVKASGERSPKVFKGWTLELAPGERRSLHKTHALRPVTTRRYHAGRHELDVRINGRECARAGFVLRLE